MAPLYIAKATDGLNEVTAPHAWVKLLYMYVTKYLCVGVSRHHN